MPRDKAKVENGVLQAERWILTALLNRRFTSLSAVREAELFEEVERAALKPPPERRFELAHWKKARALVEVRYTQSCVEVLLGGRRVASHMRSEERGGFTTRAEHMPASHRAHAQWTPRAGFSRRLPRWAPARRRRWRS